MIDDIMVSHLNLTARDILLTIIGTLVYLHTGKARGDKLSLHFPFCNFYLFSRILYRNVTYYVYEITHSKLQEVPCPGEETYLIMMK